MYAGSGSLKTKRQLGWYRQVPAVLVGMVEYPTKFEVKWVSSRILWVTAEMGGVLPTPRLLVCNISLS